MSRQAKGLRIHRRANGRYYIRDGQRERATGTSDRRQAETALARYIAERDRPTTGPGTPDKVTVADVLDRYGTEHAPTVRDPERIGHAISALLPILGPLPVGSITGQVCRRYAKARDRAPATVRKELGTLQAAINYCHVEGHLTAAPRVKLPAKPPPRDRWLTRDEVAGLLRAARSNPQDRARHLCRFILLAVHTGTRSSAILNLRFLPHIGGGWVDTERGIMHRRAAGTIETKKRQPPIPIPRPLLAHLRRWERNGARWVVEVEGQRVGNVKKAWTTALRASGIKHCTRHDMRHTAITWALQNGADIWHAAGYFGVTTEVLTRVYGHHHPDYLQSAVEAMERRPGNLGSFPDSTGLKGRKTA